MKTIYIMATGPSINDITDDEWDYLKDKETIGFSFFPFKDKKTKYHLAAESIKFDKFCLDRMKENGFTDTIIYTHKRDTRLYSKKLGFTVNKFDVIKAIPSLDDNVWVSGNEKPIRLLKNYAKTLSEPLVHYKCQLTTAINLAYTMKPTEIRLCGVELNSNKYFYDDYKELETLISYHEKVNREVLKKHKDWDINKHHPTAHPFFNSWHDAKLATIVEYLRELNKEMKEEGINMCVCTKNSLLYTDAEIEYKGIMDVDI